MAMKSSYVLLCLLIANLVLVGCNGSQSSVAETPSTTTNVANNDDGTVRQGVLGIDYTADDVDNVMSAVSAGLRQIPWDTMDWDYYADQSTHAEEATPSMAIVTKPLLIVQQEGLSVFLGFVKDQSGQSAVQLTCYFSGYKLPDTPLMTEQTLSGAMCVNVLFDDLKELRLKIRIFTQDKMPLNLSGKAMGIIPTTTLIGVPSIVVYYSLSDLQFLNDPAPSGSIILNKLFRIDLNAEWLSFFLSLLNGK